MNEIEKFWRDADESQDLFFRYCWAYPKKLNNQVERKRRGEEKDPNIIKWDHGEGDVEYRLEFTKEQKESLVAQYLEAHPDMRALDVNHLDRLPYDARSIKERITDEADVFVGTIEHWADEFGSKEIAHQKQRQRTITQISTKLEGLDQVFADLDSQALGFWYANVVDALAKAGLQISDSDNRFASMLSQPIRAIVEAGEFRQTLRHLIGEIVAATNATAETLPAAERIETDERFTIARGLERHFVRSRLHFESSETSFAAVCLRAIFDLAGVEVEKVSYWLKKAKDHPDSEARFLQRMRDRMRD